MKDQPLVSICIPNYNNEKFISHSIKSALSQSYKNIEVIVVDNNSSDSSWEVIKSFKKTHNLKSFKNETNVGMEKNFEVAASYSKGKYLTFLCSDDLLSVDSIRKSVQIHEKYNDLSFVFGNVSLINSNKKSTKLKFSEVLNKGEWTSHSLSIGYNFVFLSGTIINKSFLKKINGKFITPLTFFDWYLWLRLGEFKVGFNNENVGFYRYHNDNQTKIITPSLKINYFHLKNVLNDFKEIYLDKKLVDKAILKLNFRYSMSVLHNIGLFAALNFINEIYSKKAHMLSAYIRLLLVYVYSILKRKKA